MSGEFSPPLGFFLHLCHDYKTGLQATYPYISFLDLVLCSEHLFHIFYVLNCLMSFESDAVSENLCVVVDGS